MDGFDWQIEIKNECSRWDHWGDARSEREGEEQAEGLRKCGYTVRVVRKGGSRY